MVTRLRTAEDLLLELHRRRDQAMSWHLKRQLVEILAVGIRVDIVLEDAKEVLTAEVTYASAPAPTRTGRNSSQPQAQKRHNRPSMPFALDVALAA